MSEIKIGNRVVVDNYDLVYPEFKEFLENEELKEVSSSFRMNELPKEDSVHIVIKKIVYNYGYGDETVLVIMDIQTEQFYFVNIDAVVLEEDYFYNPIKANIDLHIVVSHIIKSIGNFMTAEERYIAEKEIHNNPAFKRLVRYFKRLRR